MRLSVRRPNRNRASNQTRQLTAAQAERNARDTKRQAVIARYQMQVDALQRKADQYLRLLALHRSRLNALKQGAVAASSRNAGKVQTMARRLHFSSRFF